MSEKQIRDQGYLTCAACNGDYPKHDMSTFSVVPNLGDDDLDLCDTCAETAGDDLQPMDLSSHELNRADWDKLNQWTVSQRDSVDEHNRRHPAFAKSTKPWSVRTICGCAGGHGDKSPAVVTLEITTEANTVEEVRQKVQALPELVAALRAALSDATVNVGYDHAIIDKQTQDECFAVLDKFEGAKFPPVAVPTAPTVTERVALALSLKGVVCSFEIQPGYIHVPLNSGHHFAIGTANENWSGELLDPEGRDASFTTPEDYYESEIPSDSQDVERIATSIKAFLDDWEKGPMTYKRNMHHPEGAR